MPTKIGTSKAARRPKKRKVSPTTSSSRSSQLSAKAPARKPRSKLTKKRSKAPQRVAAKALALDPFAALLTSVKPDIDARLAGFLDAKMDEIRPHGPRVQEMLREARDLCLRGGKRLRPALVIAGFQSAQPRADWDAALDAGVAIELLHAYFLIHDDWMDQDATRRGAPSVHTSLSARYRSVHIGSSSAILAGDYIAALATEALSRVDIAAARMPRVFTCFARMQADAVAGQQLDLLGTSDAERTYRLKTGSYTVRGPLVLGALLAGAKPSVIEALERYSLPVGVAFQMRDDLLSAFGDPKDNGKPFANDIRSGKRTALVAHTLRRAKASDKKAFSAAFGNAKATKKQLVRAVHILESSGARAAVERRIQTLVNETLAEISQSKLPPATRQMLTGAAHLLTERRR